MGSLVAVCRPIAAAPFSALFRAHPLFHPTPPTPPTSSDPVCTLRYQSKYNNKFWLLVLGNDCEANMLVVAKSPILYVNKLFKEKNNRLSFFSEYIHSLLLRQDTSVLKVLLLWHIALVKASVFHPSEESDLLAYAAKVEQVVNELFNCDSMDKPLNVQKLLQPDKNVSSKINLLKYQINAFRKQGLVDLCLHHECKFLFEKPQMSAFINDIFWYSASFELGKYERDLTMKMPLLLRPSMQHFSPIESVDLAFRLLRVNVLDNEYVRLTYGMRACPALRFIGEAFSKLLLVAAVATVSIFHYGPQCGTAYTKSCELGIMSWGEFMMVVMFAATVLYELGEIAQLDWNLVEYFNDEWNYMDVSGLAMIVVWLALRGTNVSEGRVFLALSAIPLSLGLLRYVAASRSMGVMVSIARAMIMDLLGFLCVYVLCVLGFGIFFQSVFYGNGEFHGTGNTALTMFEYTLNSFDFSIFDSTSSLINGLGQIVLVVYLVFTAILLVNLLIARMSNAYQRIDDKAIQEWAFGKSKTVQKNLLLDENHPFCMLFPPLNLFTTALYPIHFKYLPKGISVSGTVANVILAFIGGPVRAMAFVTTCFPAIRGVAYTLCMSQHPNVFYLFVYAVSNFMVLIAFTIIMAITAACPFVLDHIYKPLPKLSYWIERVEQNIPEYLFMAVDNMRLVQVISKCASGGGGGGGGSDK